MTLIDTRITIIKAAESIIKSKGLTKLTLQQVAEEAGVSKGGLLYHFPSKDALIKGMLEHALKTFEEYIANYTKIDRAPGAWARGYIKGTFSPPDSITNTESSTAAALIASSGINPSLLEPYIELQKNWIPKLMADGFDEATAQVIRFAVDGLWLNEALGINPLSPNDRNRFIDNLLALTRPANNH